MGSFTGRQAPALSGGKRGNSRLVTLMHIPRSGGADENWGAILPGILGNAAPIVERMTDLTAHNLK
jgi:hypothetical protein